MSEAEPTARPSEETVVAVDPRIARPDSVLSTESRAKLRWPVFAGLGLLVLLGLVFFALPRWVEQEIAAPVAVESAQPTEPSGPVLSEEELAALQAEAESFLAELIPQQAELDGLSVDSWGGDAWLRYDELGRQGDDAFLAGSFVAAAAAYRDALTTGQDLLTRYADIIATALSSASQALQAGDHALAMEQYTIVTGIEPDNAAALAGLARARTLPEVIALTRAGDAERRAGNLAAAAEIYREALAIDAEWASARSSLQAVTAGIVAARFERLMSQGFAALAAEEFDEAADHFRAALAERPGSSEALDGLSEAEQGLQLDQIALTEVRALAFERRELWQRAIDQYRAALATDATLAFAIEGLQRAQQRADLDAKLVNLVGNPDLLLEDRILAEAKSLIEQARVLAEPDTRLLEQVTELDRLMTLATTPVSVELTSDALTEVSVYRVGKLGSFSSKEILVRPGTYTAVGSRRGYRDVRLSFTVLPGREQLSVRVVCVEAI